MLASLKDHGAEKQFFKWLHLAGNMNCSKGGAASYGVSQDVDEGVYVMSMMREEVNGAPLVLNPGLIVPSGRLLCSLFCRVIIASGWRRGPSSGIAGSTPFA